MIHESEDVCYFVGSGKKVSATMRGVRWSGKKRSALDLQTYLANPIQMTVESVGGPVHLHDRPTSTDGVSSGSFFLERCYGSPIQSKPSEVNN